MIKVSQMLYAKHVKDQKKKKQFFFSILKDFLFNANLSTDKKVLFLHNFKINWLKSFGEICLLSL